MHLGTLINGTTLTISAQNLLKDERCAGVHATQAGSRFTSFRRKCFNHGFTSSNDVCSSLTPPKLRSCDRLKCGGPAPLLEQFNGHEGE